MPKGLVIAGNPAQWKVWVMRNKLKSYDYPYISSVYDFRGMRRPNIHLVGDYENNPAFDWPQLSMAQAILRLGEIDPPKSAEIQDGPNEIKSLTWRDVFDAFKMFKDWDEVVKVAKMARYKYIAFNGLVMDLDFKKICSINDLK